MKKLILFCFIILSLAACKKIFHEEEISIGKIENYDQLIVAAGGVYGGLENTILKSNYFALNLNGDDINAGYCKYEPYFDNNFPCYHINAYNQTGSIGVWSYLYKTIASANNIICQYENGSLHDNDECKIIGEIYLLRAYSYFRLTRTYGQIPLIDNIDFDFSVKKSSFIDIYKFIERDLKIAIRLLPKNNIAARIPYVTPNRGSAKAILAEVYLSWAGYPCKDISKYSIAAKEAGETIDSANYFGLGLLEDFSYLWDKAHLYNSESVFSLYCSDSADVSPSGTMFYPGLFTEIPKPKNFRQNFYPQYLTLFIPPVETNFFNNYPLGYRKDITFFTKIYFDLSKYDSFGNIIVADTGQIIIDSANPCGRIGYRKFFYDPTILVNTQYYTYKGIPRIYLFRYAQTKLTYAEAIARSGQLNEKAFECVNKIRRRAHHVVLNSPSDYDLKPGLSPEVFADSVVWERAWELCGEPEGRWFDLVRLEKVEDLPKLRNSEEGGPPATYDKSVYYFQVDPRDTVLNPNLGKNN